MLNIGISWKMFQIIACKQRPHLSIVSNFGMASLSDTLCFQWRDVKTRHSAFLRIVMASLIFTVSFVTSFKKHKIIFLVEPYLIVMIDTMLLSHNLIWLNHELRRFSNLNSYSCSFEIKNFKRERFFNWWFFVMSNFIDLFSILK